ncbi:hypothetical protein E4Q08_11080 [Candidatus Accumulibacter phosphatis]|uniref:Peptidase C-terminal archaeal/bacterial domain-containing protein n=1 Tax=Candidatus Accumulibacter contiguus TaxID=2954381 RepID=A0ABX1TB64_9PROT|nr:clostripain-related cysteine peptidase [Candidatus Accumulibacter contiguus]NMQ05771.1 hypothetical protein [Candidatus Accumulibacter contiguus]
MSFGNTSSSFLSPSSSYWNTSLPSPSNYGGSGNYSQGSFTPTYYSNYGRPSNFFLPTSSYWNTSLPSPLNYGGSGNYSQGSFTPTYYGGNGNYILGSVNPMAYGGLGNLGRAETASLAMPNLSIDAPGDQDWFKFELSRDGADGQFVGIRLDHTQGSLKLELFEAFDPTTNTTEAQYQRHLIELADGNGDSEQVSLAGLAKGSYYVRVTGVEGATNPNYSLELSAPPQGDAAGDWAEGSAGNDTAATAYDLRDVEGGRVLTGLSIDTTSDRDWFSFNTRGVGHEGDRVRIDFDNASGDLDMVLYDQNGTVVRGESRGTENFEEISLKDLAAGPYKIEVSGYNGAVNPQYTLSIIAPDTSLSPDSLEPNNGFETAFNLDLTSGVTTINATIHAADHDYFKFTTTTRGTAGSSLGIQFEAGRGDLQLQLYDQNHIPKAMATGVGGNESLSLDGLAVGTYYAEVKGANTATANAYQLHLDAPTSGETAKPQNDWTVLVYVTASTLEPFSFADINEMEKATAGLPGKVNFAVLWDQSSLGETYATGGSAAWGDTGRAVILADSRDDTIATPFERIGEKDTGNPSTLVDFVQWGATAAPASHYALVMWDHGGGSIGGFNLDNEGNEDAQSATRLYTSELASALSTLEASGIHNVDLIAFDACLMANVEVGYALRSHTDVLVASEEVVNGNGFDYTQAFSTLGIDSQASASTLAAGLVDSFQQQNQGRPEDTLAALDAGKFDSFVGRLKAFCDGAVALTDSANWNAIYQARAASTHFQDPSYCDLGQFLQNVAGSVSSLKDVAGAAYDSLQAVVIDQTADHRQTQGLSIYLPGSGTVNASYPVENQAFLAATDWGNFLNAFLTRPTSRSTGFQGDWAESNDVAARAYNLHGLIGDGHSFTGLSLDSAADVDWFRFTIEQAAVTGDGVTVNYDPADGQKLKLSLYYYDQTTTAYTALPTSNTGTGHETVSLSGQAAREYLVKIESTGSGGVSQYSLNVNAPGTVANGKDWLNGNKSVGKAHDLGVIAADAWFAGLRVDPANPDWFQFEAPKTQEAQPGTVHIEIPGSQVVTVELFAVHDDGTAGSLLDSVTGSTSLEIHYPGDPGDKYFLKLSQQSTASAAGYTLDFAPAENTATSTYILAANAASYDEGSSAMFTLATTGVSNGTVLPYVLSGTGITAADLIGGALAGNVTVNNNTATITVPLANDAQTEGDETLTASISGTSATASIRIRDTSTGTIPSPPPISYTVPGTLGNDFFLPSAGNNYLGGGGNDTYVISPHTLSGAVTAKITDTEGNNIIQLVDGMTISASSFYGNAAQLTLASGAIVQVLGASTFRYQVGANAPAGDTATTQTYSQFAATLGASVPPGSTPVPGTAGYVVPSGFTQAPTLTPAVAGSTFTVPGTLGNDFFIPSAGDNYLGGGGNDTYVISPMTLAGAVTAKITDTEGANVIQWVDGMTLTASSFYHDAAQLTLSTGAKVQILGASKFHFQLGANAPAGDTATSQTYAEFANTLGVTLPAAGAAPVSGTPNFIVPSSSVSAFTVVDLSSGTVTASAAAEEFRYDFQIVGGRITKAGDGEVTIHGFDVVKDKLVFVNTTNHTVYSEAEFKVLPGVSVAADPFGNNTSIYFDPASGIAGGVTLTGISDALLSQIVVEMM